MIAALLVVVVVAALLLPLRRPTSRLSRWTDGESARVVGRHSAPVVRRWR